MARKALFGGLVVDEDDQPVQVVTLGDEAFYVVDDEGFLRHVPSEQVDRQVLEHLGRMIEGHEDLISRGTAEMIGQDDIFTKAAIEASLHNLQEQFDALIQRGMPDEAQAWLGMMGFRVVVDIHGNVVRVEEPPGSPDAEEDGS